MLVVTSFVRAQTLIKSLNAAINVLFDFECPVGRDDVALFTLVLPFLIMMLSHVMRVDDVLRKELDWLEAAEGQCYYSDEI